MAGMHAQGLPDKAEVPAPPEGLVDAQKSFRTQYAAVSKVGDQAETPCSMEGPGMTLN